MDYDNALFTENERLTPDADGREFASIGRFVCESGASLDDVTVAYETWGSLNAERSNAVLVCHALSGDSHAIGWWDRLVGPGRPIDTDRFYVIGTNALGGCRGTTGPATIGPDGKRLGSRFPWITVGDMVDVQARLLDHLGVGRLALVAGGSMGGMQALEWSVRHPSRVAAAWITASTAAHNAMQIGFNETARQAVLRDPKWLGGDYPENDPPVIGLAVARMLGHLSYLSESSFEHKFARNLQSVQPEPGRGRPLFQVESYLRHQADKFTKRFDAGSLVVLADAIDRYRCASLEPAECRYLFTSFSSDWLYPSHQSRALVEMAARSGKQAQWDEIDLPFGHDAFLLDGENQGELVRKFLLGNN